MTRQEHLDWCKRRAMEYVDSGNLQEAFASMASDVTKHPETSHHMSTNQLGMSMLMAGHIGTEREMTNRIQGYN